MKESLDQERARFAWAQVKNRGDKYAKLAKGAPALIMQSGLMPVLAFMNEKSEEHHKALLEDLCEWLQEQFSKKIPDSKFSTVMAALMGEEQGDAAVQAQFYRMATDEALALLRWIRQFAKAVGEKTQGEGEHA